MKTNEHPKFERIPPSILKGITLLAICFLIYKSLHHCNAIFCKCGMTDTKDYLTVLGGAYTAHIVLRINMHTRKDAVKYSKELGLLIYFLSLLPHGFNLFHEGNSVNAVETLMAIAILIGIEILINVYLWMYDKFNKPPRGGRKPNQNPTPLST